MKLVLRAALVTLALSCTAAFALMEPDLANRLSSVSANGKLPVEFFMTAQTDARALDASIENLPRPERRARVAQVLQEFSAGSQADLLAYLKTQAAQGKVDDIQSLWLANMVACWATKDVIYGVESRSDVRFVVYGKTPVELGKLELGTPPVPVDGIEPNMVTTNVRGAWAQGYHGESVVLGVVDTGVWYTHDDLTGHLWESTEYPNHGFNYASSQFSSGHPGPSTYDTLTPLDYYGHGTHCAGIATADGAYGNGTRDTMGIAPSTALMCLPVDVYIHSPYPDTSMENNMILGFQFCVSPPRDPTNGADVITTSLGLVSSWLPRRAIFRAVEVNIEAAGLIHCIAAGNEGPTPRTIRASGDCPPPWPNPANNPTDHATSSVITVGATDNSDAIASFSSIGPSDWGSIAPYNDYAYPPGLIDPDVCMPGVNILSTYYNGNQAYTQMSGTSMATPGAAGVVCLMRSKNPNLTGRQCDSILEMHAVRDLGPTGKENTYGAGRINCSLAVAFTPLPSGVRLWHRIIDDVAGGNGDGIVNPGEDINMPTWVINLDNVTHSGVTGQIAKSAPSALFTIADSVKSFGTILPTDSAYTGASGYKITVSGSAVNGDVLGMDLTLRDANDSVWVEGFSVTVGAPILAVSGVVINDSVGGNGNHRLDPGEEADVIVQLKNNGNGNSYNTDGTLASSNPSWLTVIDPDGAWDTILTGAVKGNTADPFHVSASGSAQPGTMVPCTLHVNATGYSAVLTFGITIGIPPQPPGTVIWGPKSAPGMPSSWGLYGMGYDYVHDVLYVTYHGGGLIYKYSGDSMLTQLGTIPTPHGDTGCHDIKYCAYDNTLWLHNGETYTVDKIGLDGTLLRSFPTPAEYPTGLAWDEASRHLYVVDRLNTGTPGRVFVCDTMGNTLYTITHPLNSQFGPRCAAIDYTNSNPYGRTFVNLFTWCLSGAPDSAYVYEMDTLTGAIYNSFTTPDPTWNSRGVEYDPRDGSYWIGIMQNLYPPPSDNSIIKVYGFHIPTAIAEPANGLPASGQLWVRARPNPFRSGTMVSYNVPVVQGVAVRVYDAAGREVRTLTSGKAQVGTHDMFWNGLDNKSRAVSPGIYFVRCETESATANSKMIYLK